MTEPLSITNFALYAERSLALGDHGRVFGGDLGVRSRAEDGLESQLQIGSDSTVESDHEIIAPSVALGPHVRTGPIQTDSLVGDDIPLGPQQPFPASAMPVLPLAPSPTVGNSSVTVISQEVRTLVPGDYADLMVFGSLVLNPGDYVFSSATIADGANVTSVGEVRMVIADYLTAGRGARLHPQSDQPPDQLVVSVSGTDETVGRPAISFGEHAQVRALLNAPHGTVSLADHVEAAGAVAGFDIACGRSVRIRHAAGFPQDPPSEHGSQQLTGSYGVPAGPGTAPLVGPVPGDAAVAL